ncbi:hypothetical protein FKM82_006867 [Ascaphus truei]
MVKGGGGGREAKSWADPSSRRLSSCCWAMPGMMDCHGNHNVEYIVW